MYMCCILFTLCMAAFVNAWSAEPIDESQRTALAIYGIDNHHETLSLRAKRSCGSCCGGGSCCGTISVCAPLCCPQPSPCSCCGQPSCSCCQQSALVIPIQTCSTPCSCCGQPSCGCQSCCPQPSCCSCCQPVCTPVCIMGGGCSCGCTRGGCRRKRNSFLAIANEELEKGNSMPAVNLFE